MKRYSEIRGDSRVEISLHHQALTRRSLELSRTCHSSRTGTEYRLPGSLCQSEPYPLNFLSQILSHSVVVYKVPASLGIYSCTRRKIYRVNSVRLRRELSVGLAGCMQEGGSRCDRRLKHFKGENG